jgi:hypothetical protein
MTKKLMAAPVGEHGIYSESVRATMMLADSAQVAEGKLYILGGGWSITSAGGAGSAVACLAHIDAAQAEHTYTWTIALEDADGLDDLAGRGVSTDRADRPDLLRWHADLERNPDRHPPRHQLALLLLEAGSRYVWRLMIDGKTPPGGTVASSTRPAE